MVGYVGLCLWTQLVKSLKGCMWMTLIPPHSTYFSYAHEEEKRQTNEVSDGVGEMAGGSCA